MYEIPTGIATNQTRTHTVTALALSTVAAHVGGAFAGGFGFLFILIPLFWIGLFVLIFAIAGRRWRRNAWAGGYGPWAQHHSATRGAEVSLAERFAQGDIDEKEYRARLEVLRANASQGPQPR